MGNNLQQICFFTKNIIRIGKLAIYTPKISTYSSLYLKVFNANIIYILETGIQK